MISSASSDDPPTHLHTPMETCIKTITGVLRGGGGMVQEKIDANTEALIEILESQHQLASLLEESIHRQDDLVHELRRVVDHLDTSAVGKPELPHTSQDGRKHMRIGSMPISNSPSIPEKCLQCPRFNQQGQQTIVRDDYPEWVTEWSEHPLWSSYTSTTFRSRYRI